MGLGGGYLFLPSVAIVATYFSTKRAFGDGYHPCGSKH